MEKRKKTLHVIIAAIVVCAAAYIIVFHALRPIMWGWETKGDFEETATIIKADGTEEIEPDIEFQTEFLVWAFPDNYMLAMSSFPGIYLHTAGQVEGEATILYTCHSGSFGLLEDNIITDLGRSPERRFGSSPSVHWTPGMDTKDGDEILVVLNSEKNQNLAMYSFEVKIDGSKYSLKSGNDYWNQVPSIDPVETVRSAIENQIYKDYTISVEIENIEIDEAETARVAGNYSGSELAQAGGWTNEVLADHFVVIRAVYNAEYDHTKTFLTDGRVTQDFYLIEDTENGLWRIRDNTGPYKVDE